MGIVIVLVLVLAILAVIRKLADLQILWAIVPSPCYSLVTTKANVTGDITKGGGGVVDIIHNIPGKKLVKDDPDPMKWEFVEGRERRSLLFWLIGVEWIGPYRTLRDNKVRRFRYSKREDTDKNKRDGVTSADDVKRKVNEPFKDYQIENNDLQTKYVPYSGEQAVVVTDAESDDVFELNFLFNIIEENVFPLRAILRVADANAILAGMIKEKVNAVTGSQPPERFIKATAESTAQIVAAAQSASNEARDEVGKAISKVTLISTDMDEDDRALFELPAKTEREKANELLGAEKDQVIKTTQAETTKRVTITEAEGTSEAMNRITDAKKKLVNEVLLPMSANENTVRVFTSDREAAAYEANTTVTTFAPGGQKVVPLGT